MVPKYTIYEAKQKIEAYCAYQERSAFEVSKKLTEWGIYSEDIDQLLADLIVNNFLNEERFARAYVSGKFRIKKWGRKKILPGLKQKQISDYSIRKGMEEIDEDDYLITLNELAAKKNSKPTNTLTWDEKAKLTRYLQSKGYEYELINAVVFKE
ncbi:regulatory protein RecX [Crocinitomix catalasitica]|uniref:regulatory protein RecX n=1 Tax=Crocinitomix catalasitica TaxID=184607 RepID=UPI000482B846|nr:regulatory protein RecX [Crocinitomix catalasitica]